jgi:hypothetical protein
MNPKAKGSYTLGKMVYHLPDATKKHPELINISRNLMVELRDKINETVILSIIKNNKRVLLNEIPSTHEIHVQTKKEASVYSTTTGRIILAHSNPENKNWIIDRVGLPSEEEWSGIKSKDILIEELKNLKLQEIIETKTKSRSWISSAYLKNNSIIASLGIYLLKLGMGMKKRNFEKRTAKCCKKNKPINFEVKLALRERNRYIK